MAADEFGAVVLAALQVDCLSVAVNQYVATRQALIGLLPEDLGELRTQVLHLRSAHEVRDFLTDKRRQGKTPATV
jgi:phosphoenolpyruvate-protein kinase (PTS system EI component)